MAQASFEPGTFRSQVLPLPMRHTGSASVTSRRFGIRPLTDKQFFLDKFCLPSSLVGHARPYASTSFEGLLRVSR